MSIPTEKQRRFVEYYMGKALGNGTKAAKLAGYKGNNVTLSAVAVENLQKPLIKEMLAERRKECPAIASREELQSFWTAVVRKDKEKAKMPDRLKASEYMGKSLGVFTTKVEHSLDDDYDSFIIQMSKDKDAKRNKTDS